MALNKVTTFGKPTLSTLLQDNLVTFFDWEFLNAGGFTNIEIPTSGWYGADKHQLRLVDDPRYDSGQVWEGFRKNWVWESGLSAPERPNTTTTPANPGISGVYVGGAFKPITSSDSYAHHIDYKNGRVVFDSAIDTSSTVTAEYSYRYVDIMPANSRFFREIQYRTQRADEDFQMVGSGDYSTLGENRVQLPAVGIEIAGSRTFTPYELGSSKHELGLDVIFHILAEEDYERDQLIDMISFQEENVITLFDTNAIGENNAFPMDYRGMVNPYAKTYPALVRPSGVGGFAYQGVDGGKARFTNTRVANSDPLSTNLYHGTVRVTMEVIN